MNRIKLNTVKLILYPFPKSELTTTKLSLHFNHLCGVFKLFDWMEIYFNHLCDIFQWFGLNFFDVWIDWGYEKLVWIGSDLVELQQNWVWIELIWIMKKVKFELNRIEFLWCLIWIMAKLSLNWIVLNRNTVRF